MLKKYGQDQNGFSIVVILLAILVSLVVVGTYTLLRNSNTNTPSTSRRSQSTTNTAKTVEVKEGQQAVNVDKDTTLVLPSGATIDLEYFTFNPTTRDSGDVETNQFKHSATFRAYHKGYTYSLSDYTCQSGEVFHDDYTSNDRLSCSFTITTDKTDPPTVSSYAGITATVSTQSNQSYDHSLISASLSDVSQKAYYDIEVPYLQFWGKANGTYWGASGNTLRIKTVFGVGTINFNENSFNTDIRAKTPVAVTVGSVTAQVHMTGVSCYAPYLNAQGQCSPSVTTSGPNKGEVVYVYNRVDYAVSFIQAPANKETPDHLVLHY